MARSLYRYRYDLLTGWGFLPFESREFARQYSVSQIRSLPYMVSLTRWRRLYVSNLRNRGLSNKEIIDRLKRLYGNSGWIRDGKLDPWAMLRRFRKQAIEDDEYIPPKRKGSHHKQIGVSKGDVTGQKQRRQKRLSELEKYARGRGKE